MIVRKIYQYSSVIEAVCVALIISIIPASANENVVGRPRTGTAITAEDIASAVVPNRVLTNPTQLTEKIRSILNLPDSEFAPAAHGEKNHPFTTKNANAEGTLNPIDKFPWRPTGKLFAKFGSQTFVCSASVIGKSLIVTAAHCVHNFGDKSAGFTDAITFEPARYDNTRPFGTWTGREWWIPKVYFEGTDVCTTKKVVCENDLAVIVMERRDDKSISDLTGVYGYKSAYPPQDFGYAFFLGNKMAQLTVLGYPAQNYDGFKMVRTDAIGYQDEPNNVIFGSNQTGGSSGGPVLVNFGTKTSYTGFPATDDEANQVVGVVSWGYVSDKPKIQGASRFSKNKTYTIKSNIDSLVGESCSKNVGFC